MTRVLKLTVVVASQVGDKYPAGMGEYVVGFDVGTLEEMQAVVDKVTPMAVKLAFEDMEECVRQTRENGATSDTDSLVA